MPTFFSRRDIPVFFLTFFTLTETLCCTYIFKSDVNTEPVAISYFLMGLAVGIFPLLMKTDSIAPVENKTYQTINQWLVPAAFLLIAIYFVYLIRTIFQTWEINIYFADMLPQIKVMCQRLIDGKKIYAPIMEIWNGKPPPYLPMMWLPFTFTQWAGIDIRWTYVVTLLGGLYLLYRILPQKFNANSVNLLIALGSLFFLFNFMLLKDRITFGQTEEGLVISFYLFLGYALYKRNAVLIGLAISCCLLSRFSLFFWIPMYILYVFFFESKRQAYIITAVVALIVFFVFLLPFGFWQPEYFLNIPADYQVGVDNAWSYNRDVDGKYYQKFLGYARYFDISDIKMLHSLQIGVAAVLPFLLLGLYSVTRKKVRYNTTFFGICTLKIILVFFYNMVEVPYYYLFFVSTFLSYGVLLMYFRQAYHPQTTAV